MRHRIKSIDTIAKIIYQSVPYQQSFRDFIKWRFDDVSKAFVSQLQDKTLTPYECKLVANYYMTKCSVIPSDVPGVLLALSRQFNCTIPLIEGILTEQYWTTPSPSK